MPDTYGGWVESGMRSRDQFDKLLLLAFLLNVFDAVITIWGINHLNCVEMNPLMDTALGWGALWFVVIKIVVMFLACFLLWYRYERMPRGVSVAAVVVTAMLLIVCCWNIREVSQSPVLSTLADSF